MAKSTIVGIVELVQNSSAFGRNEEIIRFEDGQVARLATGNLLAETFRSLLDDARSAQVLVYVELGDPDNLIVDVRIPLPVDVVRSVTDDQIIVEVALTLSPARHFLDRSNPDFERLRAVLESTTQAGTGVIITETNDHKIIDIRETSRPFEILSPRAVSGLASAITMDDAEKLFAMVSNKTCNATKPNDPCIPFLYPDDGCYARAHDMGRLIGSSKSGKVWNYQKTRLVAKTVNHPSCKVEWQYHVAPTVSVDSGSSKMRYVLDPSLFGKPVTIADWKGVQGDKDSQIVETDAEAYYRAPNGTITKDPNYIATNKALAIFRLKLKERSLSPVGAPPYKNCTAAIV